LDRLLVNTNWTTHIEILDANKAVESFVSYLSDKIKLATETTKVSAKKTMLKEWMTPGILSSIRKRDKLYQKFMENAGNTYHKVKFIKYRNNLSVIIKKTKERFTYNKLQINSGNIKKQYHIMKTYLNLPTTKNTQIDLSSFKNLSSVDVANRFNYYFSEIGNKITANMSFDEYFELYNYNIQEVFNFTPITETEVALQVKQLGNKLTAGHDGITCSIIKRYSEIFVPVLCQLFNKCIISNCFPDCLKRAIVVPIFKSGCENEFGNYRPISILSNISKIFEKIIFNRMNVFIDKHNILHKNQYGFRKNRSCEDAVLHLSEHVTKNLDQKLKCLTIFLDLQKAFDTVNHKILLKKLNNMGFKNSFLHFIESYLYNRKQC